MAVLAFTSPALAGDPTLAMRDYNQCIVERTKRVLVSCESPDILATAVIGGCSSELKLVTREFAADLGPVEADALAERARQSRYEVVVATIVERRLRHPC